MGKTNTFKVWATKEKKLLKVWASSKSKWEFFKNWSEVATYPPSYPGSQVPDISEPIWVRKMQLFSISLKWDHKYVMA
jgi:hypothetical protein